MTNSTEVFIAGVGMITAVGGNAAMTAASVKSGLSRFTETAILNKRLRPIKMSLVPDGALPEILPELADSSVPARQQRLVSLAAAALLDLQDQGFVSLDIPLFLALPETLPGSSVPPFSANLIKQIAAQSGVALNIGHSRTISMGRVGGLHALDLAQRYFEATGAKQVLVGGVDTYFDPHLLARLDAEDRLLVQDVVDGFIPGEGAAILVLKNTKAPDGQLEVRVAQPGFGSEAGHRYSDKPYLGEGMAQAVGRALAQGQAGTVNELWTTLNGESFGQKELAVAMARNSQQLSQARIEHPADCYGDIGAASVLAMLGLIKMGGSSTNRPSRALICGSSDADARAAVLVDIGQ